MSMEWIESELGLLLEPLERAANSVYARRLLLLQLRIDFDEAKALAGATAITSGLESAVAALRTLRGSLQRGKPQGLAAWGALLEPVIAEAKKIYGGGANVVDAVDNLAQIPPPDEVLKALGNLLLYRWLETYHPIAYACLMLLGVLQTVEARVPIQVNPRQLRALLRDPGSALVEYYRKGPPRAQGARVRGHDQHPSVVAGRLAMLLDGMGMDVEIAVPPTGIDSVPLLKRTSTLVMGQWAHTFRDDKAVEVRAELASLLALLGKPEVPPEFPMVDGLALGLAGQLAVTVPIRAWELRGSVSGQAAVLTIDDKGLKLEGQVSAGASLTMARPSQRLVKDGKPIFRIGAETGTRVELWGASLGLAVTSQPDVSVAARLKDLRLVLDPGDGDGFLAEALAAAKIEVEVDLGLVWSQRKGLAFEGGGGLIIDIPLRESVGPGLAVPLIHGEVELVDDGVRVELSAEVTLRIGAFAAAVRRMGLHGRLPFADDDRETHAKFGFKPPSGIGLTISSPAVTGGGSLEIDVEKGRYFGSLELSLKVFGITAIGLLLTKMPDGGPGWALYFSLFAKFSPAIQIGFGFGISGVGGILAVHRRLDKEALKQVVRAGNIDAVLFPGNVSGDPGRVLTTIESLFPVARGSCVFGPAVRIIWGKDDLVTGSLGVYVSLPDPVVIALVGRLEIKVLGEKEQETDEEQPSLVYLRMDVGGAADLSEGTFALDARVTGKITILELFGDMAFRARVKHKPGFLLSVGGFHPEFDPPADLQEMERMTAHIGFKKGPIDVGLTFQSYLALTSNTFQFGASIDVLAQIGGFVLAGGVHFNALVVFKPFHLVADMGGFFSVTVSGNVWFAVSVEVELEGPGPWEVRGVAHLQVLKFAVDKRFSGTIGDATRKQKPATLDPWNDVLLRELTVAGNWKQEGVPASVRMRALTDVESKLLWLEPSTEVQFRQRHLPLAREIDRIGSEAVARPTTLKIVEATIDGQAAGLAEIRDEFAPADWRAMSVAQKLASPSFEPMVCGAAITAAKREVPAGKVLTLTPEPIRIGDPPPSKPNTVAELLAQRRVIVRGVAVGPFLKLRTR